VQALAVEEHRGRRRPMRHHGEIGPRFVGLVIALSIAVCHGGCDEDEGPVGNCEDAAAFFDFESGDQDFVHTTTDSGFEDPWYLGDPYYVDCQSGERCWATILTDEYPDCAAGGVYSPTIDLSACAGSGHSVELRFWHLYRLEDDYGGTWYDGALVQITGTGGAPWQDVDPDPGYTGLIEGNYSECAGTPEIDGRQAWSGIIPGDDWSEVVVEIDELHRTADFRFAFVFGSDRGANDDGWFIDDVEIRIE